MTHTRLTAFQKIISLQKEATDYIEFCNSSEEAKKVTRKYFSKQQAPDAVFCMSDEIFIGVMKSLNELKIAVPAQTAVITLSDGFLPKFYTPEITFVETSAYKLGKLAFIRMLNCLNGNTGPTGMFSMSHLVKGGSI